ncbi:MAG: MFS transporter [Eubacteriales bacterium]|nr:MFS transporter [Eubacteriales bacterium]
MLVIVWLAFAINCSCREIMNKVMPSMVDYFGMSSTTSGLISTVGTVGAGIMAVILGRWADGRGQGYKRRSAQIIIAVGYLVLTMLTGVPMVASSLGMIFILQFLRFGFAGGGEGVDGSAISEWWPMEARGFILSVRHTAYPWGTAIIAVLIAAILDRSGNNWRLPFIIIPMLAIPFWVIYLLYANKKRMEETNRRMVENGLTPSITVEEIENPKLIESAAEETEGAGEKRSFFAIMKNRNVLACFLCYMCIIGAYFGLNYWMTPYLTYIGEMTNSSAAIFSTIFAITAGLGQIFWGTFSDRIGCKRTILICSGWLFVCFCFLPAIKNSMAICIGIQLLMGFCTNASFPVLFNFAGMSVKKNELATAIGICNLSQVIGGMAPYLLGIFISIGGGWKSATGYNISLYFMLGCLALGFLVILLMSHEVTGPRRGRDWALSSFESCGVERAKNNE